MNQKDILLYELPSIAEYTSVSWAQTVIAKYTSRKVNRKWKRYQKRLLHAKIVTQMKHDNLV
jgi:hypothetical protein